MSNEKTGGIHINGTGRDVKVEAGGDIVGGDKVTTTHVVFGDRAHKQEFLDQLDELRSALREIKSQIESVEQYDEDTRDQLVMEILQQVSSLKQAKQDADQMEPGEAPPAHTLQSVGQCLENAGGLLDKIKSIGETASGITKSVMPIVARALPIVASARHLLGI